MSTIQYDRVRELAKSKGLSLNDVEEKIGLKKNALYAWNRNTPSGDNLSKVADYFNVSVDYLLGRTDKKCILKTSEELKGTNTHTKEFEMIQRKAGNYTIENQEKLLQLMKIAFDDKNKND